MNMEMIVIHAIMLSVQGIFCYLYGVYIGMKLSRPISHRTAKETGR